MPGRQRACPACRGWRQRQVKQTARLYLEPLFAGGPPAASFCSALPVSNALTAADGQRPSATAPLPTHLSGSMRRMWIHSGYQPQPLKRFSMKLQGGKRATHGIHSALTVDRTRAAEAGGMRDTTTAKVTKACLQQVSAGFSRPLPSCALCTHEHPMRPMHPLPYRGMVASSSSMISALCSTPLVARSWLVCSQSV